MKASTILALLILILHAVPSNISAQSGAKLTLKSVFIDEFPNLRGFVDARDADGKFIADLTKEDFLVLEDGQVQALQNLRLTDNPWRVAVVINPSEAFKIRDAQGFSRYSYVQNAIQTWAGELDIEQNIAISLITQEGLQLSFTDPSNWISGFGNFQPDFPAIAPDLQALSSALVLTDQPAAQEGAASAIFLLTAAPSRASDTELAEIIESINNQGIPIYVWLVDSSARFDLDEVIALQNLALFSGGAYYAFSGTEELPNLQEYFDDLGNIYAFQYISDLRENGQHEISLSLESSEYSLKSQNLSLDIQLEAPNPIFVSPPTLIHREASGDDPELLSPFSQPIEIIVEFPDGYDRELLRTTLLVNGEAVAENRSIPFTHFSWELSNFLLSETVLLQVESEDELALIGRSVEIPVDISVAISPEDVSTAVIRNVPQFVLVLALLSLGLAFVFLIVTGRFSPASLISGMTDSQPAPRETNDPLLDIPQSMADMAVPFGEEQKRGISSPEYIEEEGENDPPAPAFLLPLSTEGHPLIAEMMTLPGEEHAFGSDNAISEYPINDSSVEERHSLIRRKEKGGFEILDLGGDSGTWVNYAPVSAEGAGLENGDLIHIGKTAFRFFLEKPSGRSFRERAK